MCLMAWIGSAEARHKNTIANRPAALIVEAQTGKVLFSEHADELRYPASLSKKMVLYLLFKQLENKKISFKTQFTTPRIATRQMRSRLDLAMGERISVRDIIHALIIKSANDVAVVAAFGLGNGNLEKGIRLMNQQAKALGMKKTTFYNPSGVPDNRQVSTASDMIILARALYRDFPQYAHFFKKTSFSYKGETYTTHNRMLRFPEFDGIKTGFINSSGFHVSTSAVRHYGDKPIRLFGVVMGGRTSRERDTRTKRLFDKAFAQIETPPSLYAIRSKSRQKLDKLLAPAHVL
jgi:D-alanyl-D-alanine carboxypeptidase